MNKKYNKSSRKLHATFKRMSSSSSRNNAPFYDEMLSLRLVVYNILCCFAAAAEPVTSAAAGTI